MACRINGSGTHFDRAAADLKHLTPVAMSGETLRRLVEDEGKAVFQAFAAGTPPITWTAKDCPAEVKTGLPHEKWTRS